MERRHFFFENFHISIFSAKSKTRKNFFFFSIFQNLKKPLNSQRALKSAVRFCVDTFLYKKRFSSEVVCN
jgi:hypothetical protein